MLVQQAAYLWTDTGVSETAQRSGWKSYQEDIGLHVCLHPVLDGVSGHSDEC